MRKKCIILLITLLLGLISACERPRYFSKLSNKEFGTVVKLLNSTIKDINEQERIQVTKKDSKEPGKDKIYNFFRDYGMSEIFSDNIHRFKSDNYIYIYDEGINAYKINKKGDEPDYYNIYTDYNSYYTININQPVSFEIDEINIDKVTKIEVKNEKNYKEYRLKFDDKTFQESNNDVSDIYLGFKIANDKLLSFYRFVPKTNNSTSHQTDYIFSPNLDINFCLPDNYEDFFEVNSEDIVFNPVEFKFNYSNNIIFTNVSTWTQNHYYVDDRLLYITTGSNFYAYNYDTYELEVDKGMPFNGDIVASNENYLYLISDKAILTTEKGKYDFDYYITPTPADILAAGKDKIYFIDKLSHKSLYLIDCDDQKTELKYTFPNEVFSIAYNEKSNTLYVSEAKSLLAYDLSNFSIKFVINNTVGSTVLKYDNEYIFYDEKKYNENGEYISDYILSPDNYVNGKAIEGIFNEIKVEGVPYREFDTRLNQQIAYEYKYIGGYHLNIKAYQNYFYTYSNGLCQINPQTLERTIISTNFGAYDKLIFGDNKLLWIHKSEEIYTYDLKTKVINKNPLPKLNNTGSSFYIYPLALENGCLLIAYENKDRYYNIQKYFIDSKNTELYVDGTGIFRNSPKILNGYIYNIMQNGLEFYNINSMEKIKSIQSDIYSFTVIPGYIFNGNYYYDYEGIILGEICYYGNYPRPYYGFDKYIITDNGLYNTETNCYNIKFSDVDSAAILGNVIAVIDDNSKLEIYYINN